MRDAASEDPSTVDESVLTRVRALIAKAESTDFPAEADSFMAKAQSLIEQYAIDEARLHGASPGTIGDERIPMQGSYSRERAHIWGAVAQANRCQLLTLSTPGSAAVVELCLIGRHGDRDLVKILATSLEVQAMRRVMALDTRRSPASAVVQRRSFLRGFAGEIAQRLERAKQDTIRSDGAAAALVLASEAVDEYLREHFDVSTRRSQAQHDGRAFSRGRQAGATADVGAGRLGSRQGALGSG